MSATPRTRCCAPAAASARRPSTAEKVRNLLEAKVVSALRSYAATKTLKQLHENRDAFARDIKENVIESFSANGLSLEEVTIVTLEQTPKGVLQGPTTCSTRRA